MAIRVKHGGDILPYINAVAKGRAQSYGAPAEQDQNPYTLSREEGARINASLRGDRERLGQKQKKEYGEAAFKDTEAGFNWQTPITIWNEDDGHGFQKGQIVYKNQGVDPLRTGGFGALGTGEHHVYDYGQTINTHDPEDLAKLGALSNLPGQVETPYDFFYSAREKQDDQWAREDARTQRKYEDQRRLQQEIQNESSARDFNETLRRDEAIAAARLKRDEAADARKLSALNKKTQARKEAGLPLLQAALDSFDAATVEGYEWPPNVKQRVSDIRSTLADIVMGKIAIGDDGEAQFIQQAINQIGSLNAVRSLPKRETPDQQSARELKDYEEKKKIDLKYSKPREGKPLYTRSQLNAMREDIKSELMEENDDQYKYKPDPKEVERRLEERINQLEGAYGKYGGQTPVPIPPQQEQFVREQVRKMKERGMSPDQIKAALQGQ